MIKHQIIVYVLRKILSILKKIIKNEDSITPLINYPVLIGSRAAKWHVPSFREPNDWDLVATISQSISFISKVKSIAAFKDIKLIYYSGGGIKIIGECIEPFSTDRKSIIFDIELISDKVDLRKMKPNEALDRKECDENNSDEESDIDFQELEKKKISEKTRKIFYFEEKIELGTADDSDNKTESNESDRNGNEKESNEDNMNIDDDSNEIEFEMFDDDQQMTSALMILELCRNVKDKTLFPLVPNFPFIVAPLKILEALKTSHIYWPADFHKNIADLHLLRVSLDYNKMSMTQPLCSPQRNEKIELMLKTRIKETEIIRGIPGAHINLNMTNEEFLEREDNLLVQKRILHDDIHELVKYGDHPIYEGLKNDKVITIYF